LQELLLLLCQLIAQAFLFLPHGVEVCLEFWRHIDGSAF